MSKSVLFTTNDPDSISGSCLGSFPLTTDVLTWLQNRINKFRACLRIYPELYETYEFDVYGVEYYDTGEFDHYDNTEDLDKLGHLGQDGEIEFYWTAELDKLTAGGGPPWIVVPTHNLPGEGNVRTECHRFVIRNDPTGRPFELSFCFYVKHTDQEVTTTPFTSADVEKWLQELTEEEKGAT